MKAMVLNRMGSLDLKRMPLELEELPAPEPDEKQLLIQIKAVGVCHTEIDEIEGRTPPKLPVIPGHQVVGIVTGRGKQVKTFREGDRVGVGWIFSSCRECEYCRNGLENLCSQFMATGRDANGGYAEYMVVDEGYAFYIPSLFSDMEAAPLLCAGAIGYRSLCLSGIEDGQNLGLTGFGASGHLVLKMARYKYPHSQVYVFARSEKERAFAISLGAVWSGSTEDIPPVSLKAIIDTTPVWKPVVEALKNLAPGGRLVINAIRKEDTDKDELLKMDYPHHLWMEKEIKSVANVTRKDIREFLKLAADIPVKPEIQEYTLEEANRALFELKQGNIKGAKVLRIS